MGFFVLHKRGQLEMITNKNEGPCHPDRSQTHGESDLRCLINNTIIEDASTEYIMVDAQTSCGDNLRILISCSHLFDRGSRNCRQIHELLNIRMNLGSRPNAQNPNVFIPDFEQNIIDCCVGIGSQEDAFALSYQCPDYMRNCGCLPCPRHTKH